MFLDFQDLLYFRLRDVEYEFIEKSTAYERVHVARENGIKLEPELFITYIL